MRSAVRGRQWNPAVFKSGKPDDRRENCRVSGYFISAREFEELQRLRAFERRVHRINDLPAEIADAIEGSKMSPAHDHLNELPDEK